MTFAYNSVRQYIERGLVRPLIRTRVSNSGNENLPVDQDLTTDKMGKALFEMLSVTDRIGRPYVMPPRTPVDVVNIIRTAFVNVSKDREARAEAAKLMMDISYLPAEECLKEMRFFFNQPPTLSKSLTKKEMATTTPLWKASGVYSRMNRTAIADMQPDKRRYRTLPSTSRFSITGKENRPGCSFCLPLLLNDGSMKKDWPHEMFGVHYRRPTSARPKP